MGGHTGEIEVAGRLPLPNGGPKNGFFQRGRALAIGVQTRLRIYLLSMPTPQEEPLRQFIAVGQKLVADRCQAPAPISVARSLVEAKLV